MQATLLTRKAKKCSPKMRERTTTSDEVSSAAAEIHSFLAVRDALLGEAEESPNEANLHRLWMANEFAERCLEPARPPYQAQSLPVPEAARERQRCKTIKLRIAELRNRVRRHAA
jgi:hypothetical protein